MNFPEIQYCILNKFQFLAIGLWPYQQSEFARFQFIFFSIILLTSIIFQLTTLTTLKCTTNLVAKVLSSVTIFIMFMSKYISFRLNIEIVKDLLMQLQHIYNEIKDENEIAIIEKYDYIAKRFTNSFTTIAVSGIFFGLIIDMWLIINVDLSINASQLYQLPIMMEYFINQEKTFYLTLLHVNVAMCIGIIITLATNSMFITYILHTCGIFRIASYRIENAMNIKVLQNITMEGSTFTYNGIICAVNIHRQALKLFKRFESSINIMVICLIVCGVIALSLNLYQIASFTNNVKELLLSSCYVFLIILYMFLSNYMGQNILEHNKHVFVTVYNVQWYEAPLYIQKMILFLLQKGVKEYSITIAGLFHSSLEYFATLLKTSASYFTVIYSMQ